MAILLYIKAGADIFDGLAWFRRVMNLENYSCLDKSFLPVINCTCEVCKQLDWESLSEPLYETFLCLHNLHGIDNFLSQVRNYIQRNKLADIFLDLKEKQKYNI